MVLLELMSAGLVAVAFDGPTGPGEVIDDGVNGLLVPPDDVVALAAALIETIQEAADWVTDLVPHLAYGWVTALALQ